MALSKIQPASMDLTANYAFTGTNSMAGLDYEEKLTTTLTASSSDTLSFTSSIDSAHITFISLDLLIYIRLKCNGDFRINISGWWSVIITAKQLHSFAYQNESGTLCI